MFGLPGPKVVKQMLLAQGVENPIVYRLVDDVMGGKLAFGKSTFVEVTDGVYIGDIVASVDGIPVSIRVVYGEMPKKLLDKGVNA